MSNPISSQFVFYLEGVRVPFSRASVASQINGITSAEVSISFDRKKGLIRKIRAKTMGHLFFLDRDNELRLIFEGELTNKSYGTSPAGPTCALSFSGIAANYQYTTFAVVNQGDSPSPVVTNGLVNMFGHYLFAARSVFVGVNKNIDGAQDIRYKSTPALSTIFSDAFNNKGGAVVPGGGFSYVRAFANVLSHYLRPPAGAADITSGLNATLFLRIAEYRFGLISGLAGATSLELSNIFFGEGAMPGDKNRSELFLGSVLNSVSGSTDVFSVLRQIAGLSFHSVSETLCPATNTPVATPKEFLGVDSWKNTKTAMPRLTIFPMMFNADPPVCNLFLSQMTTALSYGVDCVKPTRFTTTQATEASQTPGSAVFIASILPKELEDKILTTDTDKFISHAAATTREELEIGVILADDSNRYPSNIAVSVKLMREWMDATADMRFYARRQGGQGALVSMDFNPYPVVGMPGAFVDAEHGVGRGMVVAVQHTVSPSSASTEVAMSTCIFGADALDNAKTVRSIEDGYGNRIPSFANETASAYYESVLGVPSAFKAVKPFVQDHPKDLFDSTPPDPELAAKQKEAQDKENARSAAVNAAITLDSALMSVETVTRGADSESARAAQEDFVSRPIATLLDLVRVYADDAALNKIGVDTYQINAGNATQTTAANAVVFSSKGTPDTLPFIRPFIAAGITRLVSTVDGKTAPLVIADGENGYFLDRREPVLAYLREINNG